MLDEDRDRIAEELLTKLNWTGPVYYISAVSRIGTQSLCNDIMQYLDQDKKARHKEVLQSIPQAQSEVVK